MWFIRLMPSPSSIIHPHGMRSPCDGARQSRVTHPRGTAHGLRPWDRLPACPLLHDVGSEMLMVAVLFLLKLDRLEAYPTCIGSVDHTQTDRTASRRTY